MAEDLNETTVTSQRESEEMFRALFESASDAIIIVQHAPGQKPFFIECNTRALEMFDCTREEIVWKTFYNFSPRMQPDNTPSDEKAIAILQTVMDGEPMFFEWTYYLSNDFSFQTEVSLKRIDAGDKTYVQAVVHDISERKWIENALKDSEEYARSFIDSSQDGVSNLTIEGNFISMNPTAYALNDIDESDDLAGLSCTGNITENRSAVQEAITRAAEGEKTSVQYKTVK